MDNMNNGSRPLKERREESYLSKCLLGDTVRDELRELDKHEVIVKIAEIIGPSPLNLCIAEHIFDMIRFDMARYVLHHDYSTESGIRTKLLLWLDGKINPQEAVRVTDFFDKYIK